MIRIGFDPMLEAQQRQRELLKEVEQYRLIGQASEGRYLKTRISLKFLAVIGKEMASLGGNLEERYGGRTKSEFGINQSGNPEGCG